MSKSARVQYYDFKFIVQVGLLVGAGIFINLFIIVLALSSHHQPQTKQDTGCVPTVCPTEPPAKPKPQTAAACKHGGGTWNPTHLDPTHKHKIPGYCV